MPSLYWLVAVLAMVAAVHDWRTGEIPDWVSVLIAAAAAMEAVCGWREGAWLPMVLGGMLGFVVSGLLYWRGAWGGGDVKLIAALGVWLGPAALVATLFWVAIVGAILSLAALARGEKSLAYGPAIAAGLLIYGVWPDALTRVAAWEF